MTNRDNTPEETRPLIERMEEYLAGFPFYRTLSVVVVLIGLLVFFWPMLTTLPVWPITTKGRIFVESPEVYTRERLVNDRFGQAFWLEQQLEKLDEATNFTSARRDMALQIALATDADPAVLPMAELTETPFDHVYQIKSALRAKIRQALLENQLDDRHDLTGNSVYGLKFDTSVIPGANTRSRAYVKIDVVSDPLPETEELPEVLGQSLNDLRRSYRDENGTEQNRFREFPDHYEKWVESIESRLNSYLADIPIEPWVPRSWPCHESPEIVDNRFVEPVPEREIKKTTEILTEALSKVLAIDARNMVFPQDLFTLVESFPTTQPIALPAPWKRYVTIQLEHNKNCRNWKQFKVTELRQNIVVADWSATSGAPEEQLEEFFKYYASVDWFATEAAEVPDEWTAPFPESEIFVERTAPDGSQFPGPEEWERMQLQFPLNDMTLVELMNHTQGFEDRIGGDDETEIKGWFVPVEVGMYNFAEDILTSESYLYTVFPKSDVTGVLERNLVSGTVGLDGLGIGGRASSSVSEATSQIVASQVSFSDDEGQDSIVFGWIIGSEGLQKPVQKSQFVLLSLPVYLQNLTLKVESGWIDRDAGFRAVQRANGESLEMRVALPPDYEAFDTLISGSKRYGPAIFDRLMEEVTVETCSKASILIPGARLWRSSQVTLAGQPADQIVVMPNMRGILAHFEEISVRPGEGDPTIQVWTSEGSDRIDGKVKVRDFGSTACLQKERPETPVAQEQPEKAAPEQASANSAKASETTP